MSDSRLNSAALRETARTLAARAGICESAAMELLDKRITITADMSNPSAVVLAEELELLLSRTFVLVTRRRNPLKDIEIFVGQTAPRGQSKTLYVDWDADKITIGTMPPDNQPLVDQHPLFLLLGACYAAAATTKALTSDALSLPLPNPLVIRFDELGIERKWLVQPLELADTYMAGAGAIGNGFLRALRHIDVFGKLNIADNDIVDDTNLQRQIFFTDSDIGKPKATALAMKAQPSFSKLEFVPHQCRLQELRSPDNDWWLKRLIVCVDSRRARRQLQDEIAGEVFDASTTDIREVVVHYHKQPTKTACMSCIYIADNRELEREGHLAAGLGLTGDQIRQPAIDLPAAETVIQHLDLSDAPEKFVGLAFDTLFKQLCGEGLLKAAPDKQILATFAFVSVLAGTLLAIELIRRSVVLPGFDDNYWRVSAWSPPISVLRKERKRITDCAFCSKPHLRTAAQTLWGHD